MPCQKPMLRQIEWGVQNRPVTKNGFLPVTSIFLKFCFNLRTSFKSWFDVPTWCTNYSYIHNYFLRKRLSFINWLSPIVWKNSLPKTILKYNCSNIVIVEFHDLTLGFIWILAFLLILELFRSQYHNLPVSRMCSISDLLKVIQGISFFLKNWNHVIVNQQDSLSILKLGSHVSEGFFQIKLFPSLLWKIRLAY